jgi:hypothetical protein
MKILKQILSYEPAVAAWCISGGLAALLAFAFHVSGTQEAAITVICAGLATVYTAVMTRPVAVPLIVGSLATIATACGAFGLHLGANEIATGATILSGILALILRQNLTPSASLASNPAK